MFGYYFKMMQKIDPNMSDSTLNGVFEVAKKY